MGIDEILGDKREEILRIAKKHGVTSIRVFGSVARGEAGPESDVDFLIDAGAEVTPWFPGSLVADLQELLGREVDVVETVALHQRLKPYVLAEAVPL
ncbi:MAG: nucleotidyltransferase family protein [Acidobacteria bacterium]|nr:nucleotidyltransferase family protein [Acidobacteriota bacterium]MBV9478284.1 nucleotidyltransferase family protein [Acidobacteriota bacterium]